MGFRNTSKPTKASLQMTKLFKYVPAALNILKTQGVRALLTRIHRKCFSAPQKAQPHKNDYSIATRYHSLSFPETPNPDISIVIPVHNKHLYTFTCLKSIHENSGESAYEVIVVDDASTDDTSKMLSNIKGITVIHNIENKGFIYSCNAGVNTAKGRFIVLLNNDTIVTRDWLSALTKTFSDFPDAGLVGVKLVYPDGKLQEAGGIVWQDASAWNYGRTDDPEKPEYSYCRAVDYCSGACLMIKRQDLVDLGLLDDYYTPAYYEDTDLAFRVRKTGKKVYYQPAVTVIHFEGVSSGTDVTQGTKRYQTVNHEKFYRRWRETLQSHRPNGDMPHLEKERDVSKRVLVLDDLVLMPDNDSGSLRMFNLLQIFKKLGYKVSFIAKTLAYHPVYTRRMQSIGIECFYLPYLESIHSHLIAHGHLYDVVLLSRVNVAEQFIDTAKKYCTNAMILFDTVDLHFLREQRQALINQDKQQLAAAERLKLQELSTARKADKTLLVSPVEIELFKQEAPDVPVALLSNIHQNQETVYGYQERKDILFIGGFEHRPNVDAMEFFINEIFPILHSLKTGLKLLIIGSNIPPKIAAHASSHIIIKGFVSDIKPIFDRIRLSIAPIRYGAGVKGKINTSMTYGVPVVATTVAAEGMNLTHGKDILVADTPEDFARQIVRAYDDEQLWTSLSNSGKVNIEEHFSFAVAERQLRNILQDGQNSKNTINQAINA
ncbi:Glycosyltransferase, GT2 family [Nitrosomonas oligotropha]|uniref:Glycosyltransferase, GT2 family n=2 Tax=Nitrosomonas oligotropha TaxID=42354 RepID=A0A1H8NYY5_9PROT|nr:Glycosyltransferase, GT2 family [Nitrosomonas oligotropha]SEO34784.1 Glycosyltransferase, GT2 family [Nitrosomonas oligotropha]